MNTVYILRVIKSELKKAKITYRDLAKELRLSEAGVKKILSKNDISLERVLEICGVLNISFAEIILASENSQQGELRFTSQQVAFLKKNVHFFHFYMKLAYEQKSPLQIQADLRLSSKSLNVYLKKLEELGLIKRHPKDRAQIVGGIPLAVTTSGTELEFVKFEITQNLLLDMKNSKHGSLFGAGLYLSQVESKELKDKLTGLMNSYSIISAANRRNSKIHAAQSSVMILQTPTSMFNEIPEV